MLPDWYDVKRFAKKHGTVLVLAALAFVFRDRIVAGVKGILK